MIKYIPPKGINKLFRKIFYGKYANWPKTIWFHLFFKEKAIRRVRNKAKTEEKLNVVFFVLNISMWKYESFFKILKDDKRFNPIIIPYPLQWLSIAELKANEKGIVDYCQREGFNYVIGYNIDSMTYIPSDEINADFVCYSQPYNNCPDFWKVEKFYKHSLVFSYPYGLPIDNNSNFTNLLVENVSWQLFHTTNTIKKIYSANIITRGKNFNWVGSTIYDKLLGRPLVYDDWKLQSSGLKRVIWAPHHTIGENDDLPFSTFLIFCDSMLRIASDYREKIQFVFKPHPMLKSRLEKIWGKERTGEYYKNWSEMPNTTVCTGDYTDLFLSSDAMIHDCAGFMMEYLFTQKPVMFLMKKKSISQYISSFSYSCFQNHYVGRIEEDIRSFLDNVVLAEQDFLKKQREDFYKSQLLPPGGTTVAQNMFKQFLSILP